MTAISQGSNVFDQIYRKITISIALQKIKISHVVKLVTSKWRKCYLPGYLKENFTLPGNLRYDKLNFLETFNQYNPIFSLAETEDRTEKYSFVQLLWPFYFRMFLESIGQFFKTLSFKNAKISKVNG